MIGPFSGGMLSGLANTPLGQGVGLGLGQGALGALQQLAAGPNRLQKVPTYTKGQSGLLRNLIDKLNQMSQSGGGEQEALAFLQNILNPESEEYQSLVAPYMREFEEKTVPGLAERFAGMGALGSSGFGQALGAAGAGLQEKLQAAATQARGNAATSLLNQYNTRTQQALGAQPFAYKQSQGYF